MRRAATLVGVTQQPSSKTFASQVALGIAATLGVVAVLMLAAVVVFHIPLALPSSGGGSGDGAGRSAASDVQVVSCQRGSTSYAAELEVKNSTDDQATYFITVAFIGGGNKQLGTGSAVVRDLEPGQTGTDKALAFGADLLYDCKVTKVTRT